MKKDSLSYDWTNSMVLTFLWLKSGQARDGNTEAREAM
jgi:hypothetical protein